jgi:hypothetical protein
MQQMVEEDMLISGSLTPAEVVTSIRDNWEKLRSKYTG